MERGSVMKAVVIICILLSIGVFVINFGIWAIIIKIATMIFHFTFNWWYVLGAAIAWSLISSLFKREPTIRIKTKY